MKQVKLLSIKDLNIKDKKTRELYEAYEKVRYCIFVIEEATSRILPALTDPSDAKKLRDSLLSFAREIACLVLVAEDRLGELLSDIVKQGKTKEYGSTGGTIPTLPVGIDKKESHQVKEIRYLLENKNSKTGFTFDTKQESFDAITATNELDEDKSNIGLNKYKKKRLDQDEKLQTLQIARSDEMSQLELDEDVSEDVELEPEVILVDSTKITSEQAIRIASLEPEVIEAKLGELLASVERRGGSSTDGTSHPLPVGINKKQEADYRMKHPSGKFSIRGTLRDNLGSKAKVSGKTLAEVSE